ncbi:hypothetical protein H5T87_09935 [bacterium]|nr:hypothetical protein [bacterium]
MKGKITFLMILLLAFSIFADGRREYPCYLLEEDSPILDGKIEEDVWNSIPEATGFYILGGEKFALEKQTYFAIGWRKDAIYIAIKCEEKDISRISAKLKDGEDLYREDSIEIFLFPENASSYLHFAVNPLGSRWNQIDASGQPGTPWDWQAKAFIGKDFWSAEIRIPFTVLGRQPKEGEQWLFNIGRNIFTGPASEHFTCWPPLKSGFHELQNFALLTFKEKSPSKQEKEEVEHNLNLQFRKFLQGIVGELGEELGKNSSEYKSAIAYGLSKEKLKDEASYLKEAWDRLDQLLKEKEPSLFAIRQFLISYPDLRSRFKEFHYKVLMEKLFD